MKSSDKSLSGRENLSMPSTSKPSSQNDGAPSKGSLTANGSQSYNEQIGTRESDLTLPVETLTVNDDYEQLSQDEGEDVTKEATVVVIPEQPVGSLDSISEEQSLPDDLTKVEKAIKQVQCAMKPNIMTQLPDKGQALKLKEAQLLSAQDALEKRSSPEIGQRTSLQWSFLCLGLSIILLSSHAEHLVSLRLYALYIHIPYSNTCLCLLHHDLFCYREQWQLHYAQHPTWLYTNSS
jgi:hypothetical protein